MKVIKQKMYGDVALIPYLSDSFFQLLNDLVTTSEKFPVSLSYPAGAIIIAVACIESYVNELIYIHKFNDNNIENRRVKKVFDKFGTDILRKVIELRKRAEDQTVLSDDLVDDLRLLISLRGRITHYSVQEEHPNNKKFLSKLERLEKHVLGKKQLKGAVSTERLLNPAVAIISKRVVIETISALYKIGYEPPRPRWIEVVDSQRFGSWK